MEEDFGIEVNNLFEVKPLEKKESLSFEKEESSLVSSFDDYDDDTVTENSENNKSTNDSA